MDKETRHNFVRRIFASTGSSYDFVVKATTFWEDVRWKKRILEIADRCVDPKQVLDLACGTGILTFALAAKFPRSRVVGIDLQGEYLRYAKAKQLKNRIENVEFHEKSAEDIREGEYDLITASYLPKYVDIDVVVGNCSKMMRQGGFIIFHDFTYPKSPGYAFFYRMYWLFLSPALSLFEPWRTMSRELLRLIATTRWVDEMQEALKAHGFTQIRVEVQRFQVAAIVYALKT